MSAATRRARAGFARRARRLRRPRAARRRRGQHRTSSTMTAARASTARKRPTQEEDGVRIVMTRRLELLRRAAVASRCAALRHRSRIRNCSVGPVAGDWSPWMPRAAACARGGGGACGARVTADAGVRAAAGSPARETHFLQARARPSLLRNDAPAASGNYQWLAAATRTRRARVNAARQPRRWAVASWHQHIYKCNACKRARTCPALGRYKRDTRRPRGTPGRWLRSATCGPRARAFASRPDRRGGATCGTPATCLPVHTP